MMNSAVVQPRVRCRQIGDADLDAVVELLRRGFPARTRGYWRQGLERQKGRLLPPDLPRYGFLLESDGVPVGVVLLLFATLDAGEHVQLRCNLSSWYVDPEFRSQASLLIFFALKHKNVVYVNVSPAPHTWSTIEAQGFRRYASGQFFSIPSLNGGVAGCRLHRVGPDLALDGFSALPERVLLLDHAAWGCLSLVAETGDGLHPFVLQPVRIRSGRIRLPLFQIIFCRAIPDYVRFAGPIGRFLLQWGIPLVVHDANGPEPGLVGVFRGPMGSKYYRGPEAPRLGDLAYTERVLFGP